MANYTAELVLPEPHPLWLRLYGTFAAPLFILLAGMMVPLTCRWKGYGFGHFLLKGFLILLTGAAIDLAIWRIYPFQTVDVLYLIGIAVPLTYFFCRLGLGWQSAIVAAIFVFTPILQKLTGYTDYPTEYLLKGELTTEIGNPTSYLNHWLVDGWFPIFPWLGFAFMGSLLAGVRSRKEGLPSPFATTSFLGLGLLTTIAGAIVFYLWPGDLYVRAGYSEMFYPPTWGFLVTATGVILTLFAVADRTASWSALKPLRALGEASLFVYIGHQVVGQYLLSKFIAEPSLPTFVLAYLCVAAGFMALCLGLHYLRNKWPSRPYLVRFYFG
jgi:uncharacterized membrane protein